MKSIKNLTELETVINNQLEIFEENYGKKYKVDFILLLQKPLIQIITLIKEKKLFYQTEY